VAEERAKRKLSAILSADVKGYSRLMGKDEISTIQTLKECRQVIGRFVQEYRGRVVDSPGDNVLAEFGSVVAIALAERAVRLAPYCPDFYLSVLAQSYRQVGRYEDALVMFEKALERARKNKGNVLTPMIGLVDLYIQLGRKEEAQSFASELLKIVRNFNLDGYSSIYGYRNPAHLDRILVNLRKAGLPHKPPLAHEE
jgi:tetratricopeptide (TPR) repeat protein